MICKKVRSNYSVWKWHLIRYCAMIWQHLVSLIPVLLFFLSTFQIDSVYCPYWVSLRSMSELSYRLFTLPDRAWISPPSSTELIVCDWQQHDANACNMLRICQLQCIFKIHRSMSSGKERAAPWLKTGEQTRITSLHASQPLTLIALYVLY